MTRRTCRTLFALVLGVLTTVLVAWALAASMTYEYAKSEHFATSHAPAPLRVTVCAALGSTRVASSPNPEWADTIDERHGCGPWWSRTAITSPSDPGRSPDVLIEDARGWPFLSMRCEFVDGGNAWDPAYHMNPYRAQGGIDLTPAFGGWWSRHSEWKEPHALPLRPMWPGFLADTVLFGAAWWGLIWLSTRGVMALRHRARRRRGHCPACASNLLGKFSAGCPECGWRRSVAAGGATKAAASGEAAAG